MTEKQENVKNEKLATSKSNRQSATTPAQTGEPPNHASAKRIALMSYRTASLPWQSGISLLSGRVNTGTGNAHLSAPLCGGDGGPVFALSYKSECGRNDSLGPKWTHTFAERLVLNGDGSVTWMKPDGDECRYAAGSYASPTRTDDALIRTEGGWRITLRSGAIRTFHADGILASMDDPHGNRITCAYAGGYLTCVTDATGRAVILTYTGTLLTAVQDDEGRFWTLGYSGGRLTSIAEPVLNGRYSSRLYSYDGAGNVTTYTDRRGHIWNYAYTSGNLLSSLTVPATKMRAATHH